MGLKEKDMAVINKVGICFENLEFVNITKGIGGFLLDKIHTSVQRTAINAIEKMETADSVWIELKNDIEYESYLYPDSGIITNDSKRLFDRILKFSDISDITLEYDDGTEERYYVPWSGSGYSNELQKIYPRSESLIIDIQKA